MTTMTPIRVCAPLLALATTAAACSGANQAPSADAAKTGGGSTGSAAMASGASTSGATSSATATASTSSASASSSTAVAAGDGGSISMGSACTLSTALRGGSGCHFLVGLGNDLDPNGNHAMDGAYTLGTTLDLHYAYLVGLPTMGGWPDWNAGGSFVNILTDSADANGVTPMFTLYGMAALGDGNFAMTTNDAAMNLYWQGAKLLFQRLAIFGKPAVVHLEPDFWGYAMQQSLDGLAKVIVTEHAPDCAGQPDTLVGMAGCLITLARTYAPKVAIGFHASSWGGTQDQVVSFFKAIHADTADFVATDVLDRDAGCYEEHTDPNCMAKSTGVYWDETNMTSPNFQEHLTWVSAIHGGLNLPVLWWQLPLGVPSTTPGGTAGHYRDDRVHYIFNHVSDFVAAGGVGVTFGTGAANQTDITTDGGQFKSAVTSYFANPVALP